MHLTNLTHVYYSPKVIVNVDHFLNILNLGMSEWIILNFNYSPMHLTMLTCLLYLLGILLMLKGFQYGLSFHEFVSVQNLRHLMATSLWEGCTVHVFYLGHMTDIDCDPYALLKSYGYGTST